MQKFLIIHIVSKIPTEQSYVLSVMVTSSEAREEKIKKDIEGQKDFKMIKAVITAGFPRDKSHEIQDLLNSVSKSINNCKKVEVEFIYCPTGYTTNDAINEWLKNRTLKTKTFCGFYIN